jgi:hypothetical protein
LTLTQGVYYAGEEGEDMSGEEVERMERTEWTGGGREGRYTTLLPLPLPLHPKIGFGLWVT